jgi:hypothetical protein
MFTTNYSCYVLKKKQSTGIAVLATLAILLLISYMVLLLAGKKLADNMKGLDFYAGIGSLMFTVLTLIIYFLSRFKVIITGDNRQLYLEVKDTSLTTPLIVEYPFQLECFYHDVHTGSHAKMKKLYVTLVNHKGEPLLTFTGALGATYNAPKAFQHINWLDADDMRRIKLSDKIYDTGKTEEITDNLKIHLSYLSKTPKG